MKRLTEKQQSILAFIVGYQSQHGYAPSVRDIADAFNLASTHGAAGHLTLLEKKGAIRRESNVARSIQVLVDPADFDPVETEADRILKCYRFYTANAEALAPSKEFESGYRFGRFGKVTS